MRIGIGGNAPTLKAIVAEARAAEAMGAATYSLSNVFAHDAIGALTVVATQTERIELLTAVVPAFPRHPMALAQQAVTAQVVAGGRLTLGIGASQRPLIERVLGLSYERPVRRMREYLQVLQPLLNGQPTRLDGEFYRVRGGLDVTDARPVPYMIAALGPHMLRLAGELSDGTVLWLTGARAVARHIAPRVRQAAADAGVRLHASSADCRSC